MASVIRGSDGFDSSDNATQTELDAALQAKMDAATTPEELKALLPTGTN